MEVSMWILIALAVIGGVWAIVATWMARTYRDQVTNVQMAAGIAREQTAAQRQVNDALVKVVHAYEGQLAEARRTKVVVEEMNRMLVAARPKPRAPRAKKVVTS